MCFSGKRHSRDHQKSASERPSPFSQVYSATRSVRISTSTFRPLHFCNDEEGLGLHKTQDCCLSREGIAAPSRENCIKTQAKTSCTTRTCLIQTGAGWCTTFFKASPNAFAHGSSTDSVASPRRTHRENAVSGQEPRGLAFVND